MKKISTILIVLAALITILVCIVYFGGKGKEAQPVTATPEPATPTTTLTPSPIPATLTPTATLVPSSTPVDIAANAINLDDIFIEGHWNILIKEVGGEILYSQNTTEIFKPASMIKVPAALLTMKVIEEKNPTDLAAYLQENSFDGRTFIDLLTSALVNSEEDAAYELISFVNSSGIDPRQVLDDWDAPHTTLIPKETTATDMGNLMEGLYTGAILSSEARQILLDLLSTYSEVDDTCIAILPDTYTIYDKVGIISDPILIGDTAIVITPSGKAYFLIYLGSPESYETSYVSMSNLTNMIENSIRTLFEILAEETPSS
jgi:hypothetical protein